MRQNLSPSYPFANGPLRIASSCFGCGGSEPSTPVKQGELSEQEKRQIKELDAQRQDEWGRKKK